MYVVWYIIVLLSRCGDKTLWFVGQAVKTPPSHGGIRGSIPLQAIICDYGKSGQRCPLFRSYIRKLNI